MINEITMDKVACYKQAAKIQIEKETTLVYGLNGSGKTTISNFLYDREDEEFSHCNADATGDTELLVYNQRFIEDNFYEDSLLKGVFTLSKENKQIKQQISEKEAEETKISTSLEEKLRSLEEAKSAYDSARSGAINKIWEIKTEYSGGDRVLEFCLAGLMRKEKLYDHLKQIKLEESDKLQTIEILKEKALAATDPSAVPVEELDEIKTEAFQRDNLSLLAEDIQSSSEGSIGKFIERLGNSSWVEQGLELVHEEDLSVCPFCQQETISEALLSSIRSVFDGDYKVKSDQLDTLLSDYQAAYEGIEIPDFEVSQFAEKEEVVRWVDAIKRFRSAIEGNIERIQRKIEEKQKSVKLTEYSSIVAILNELISAANTRIRQHNAAILDRDRTIEIVKHDFFNLMRSTYDQTIEAEERALSDWKKKKSELDDDIASINTNLNRLREKLIKLRKKTVNVDASVDAINGRLTEMGASGFRIEKHGENMYRIARADKESGVFKTLSEGEKTIISFLYFIELCHGTLDPDSAANPKSVIIDDPISSLSHIYVFNIGQYIKREFFNNPSYSQVIVLTHSLYFFYELTFMKKEDRDARQSLFRLQKGESSTRVEKMRYEEIQNDYQSYWSIVKGKGGQSTFLDFQSGQRGSVNIS